MLREQRELSSPERIKADVMRVFSPKKENLNRTLTEDELKKLCEHSKCYVNMSKWNAINEFYWQLKRRGKLENKPQHKINKLLLKLANRYKDDPTRSYSTEEIERTRECMWKLRKSWNIEWLDSLRVIYEICDTPYEICGTPSRPNYVTIIAQTPPRRNVTVASYHAPAYMENLFYDPSLYIGAEEIIDDVQTPDNTPSSLDKYNTPISLDSNNTPHSLDNNNIPISLDNNNTPHSLDSNNNNEEENSLEKLGAAVIEIINTESIPNILTQSEDTLLFDSNPDNYESFHVSIPITSTQSQEQ